MTAYETAIRNQQDRHMEHMARLSSKAFTIAKVLRAQSNAHLMSSPEQSAFCACYAERHCGITDTREAIYVATMAIGFYAIATQEKR